jgi:MSHA pilin protein MshC
MSAERGFTLPELIAVLVILGILAAVAAPKLVTSGINEARLLNETTAALRYAQSAALAMQRTVCVNFTNNTVALKYDNAPYSATIATACPVTPVGDLVSPGGASAYTVQAQGAATFTTFPSGLQFDRIGRPYKAGALLSAAEVIVLSNGLQITVERETGYVR